MSRMNNSSRSLTIISKQNGWDPTEIIGSECGRVYDNNVNAGSIEPLRDTNEMPVANQSQHEAPTPTNLSKKTSGANPFSGMGSF